MNEENSTSKKTAIQYIKELINTAKKDGNRNDIDNLNNIMKVIRDKKYGLVWEQHPEYVEEIMKQKIPIFREDSSRKIKDDGHSDNYNFILEGDNLHSLYLLKKTHLNKIDMIYIDPPYNTGNSLTYDDKRVGEEDSYRHSKWLSFMERRLKIARELLNKMGLIFISIDDNEGYDLKLLCDEIFGENNFMGSFAVVKSEGGGQAKYIVKGHDLLLVYAKDLADTKPLARPKDIRGKVFEKNGEKYWIQEDAYRKSYGKYGNLHYEEILDYKDKKFKDDIDKKIEKGEIILLDKGEEGHIIGKVRKVSDDYSKYHSVLKQLNADGKKDLAAFGLDKIFDYPKPVNLVKELIYGTSALREKDNFTVLDFFAGSGTTGQAALEFEKETGRKINFILCTDNEVSAEQKINFVKSKGFLKNYNPKAQISDSAVDKKIEKELGKYNLTMDKLVQDNLDEYESFGISRAVTYPRVRDVIKGFTYENNMKKLLFKKKLTLNTLKNMDKVWNEIDNLKQKYNYDKYSVKVDKTSHITLTADIKKGEKYEGIQSNLKYFKTDFINKKDVSYSKLEGELMNHVIPLIELSSGTDISDSKVQVILEEEKLEELIKENRLQKSSTIYMNPDIFLDATQEKFLDNLDINIKYIPDYFFEHEMLS